MRHRHANRGTCSRSVEFDLEEGIVRNVSFEGGCPGNLLGVARLAEGRRAEEVVAVLSGLKCGEKKTSCPDQFAKALKRHLPKKAAAGKKTP